MTYLDVISDAGFEWVSVGDGGYWAVRFGPGYELTLEVQVLNAGTFKLGLYREHEPLLAGEVLVDVRPRRST